jgi:hypothetical protein
MNAYFLCDKRNKVALSFAVLPEVWGNITGMSELPYETVNDLTWAGYEDHAFLTEQDALDCGVSAESITQQKTFSADAVWEEIQAECTRRTLHGGVLVGDTWFQTDSDSRSKYLGMKLMGNDLSASAQWKTLNGNLKSLTPQVITDIINAITVSDQALMMAAEAKKIELFASSSPATYLVTSGWPISFIESLA